MQRRYPSIIAAPRLFEKITFLISCVCVLGFTNICASSENNFHITKNANGDTNSTFRVISFFTGRNDRAHISFVKEANKWFSTIALKNGFSYDTTSDWTNMNTAYLENFQLVIFLDTRPDDPDQRSAFEGYMRSGGGWLGFHFAAFALTPSDFPQNWNWYHNEFLGCGQYASNTWRPTSAFLKVESPKHPAMKGLPALVKSSPNEWYRWEKDLRKQPDIQILLSIDSSSFPLGTGPKKHEIWHEGYYPVAWTNRKYNMVYFNMGHNDIDYEHGTNAELSFTFNNKVQNQLILNTVLFLGRRKSSAEIKGKKKLPVKPAAIPN